MFSCAVPVFPATGQLPHPPNALAAVPETGTASSIDVIWRASACLSTGSQARSCSKSTLPSRSIDWTVYGSQCRPSFAIVW